MLISNIIRAAIALLLACAAWSCSKAPSPARDKSDSAQASTTGVKSVEQPKSQRVSTSTVVKPEDPIEDVSKIIGKADISARGKPSCKIDFAYVGFDPEDLLWDGETCAAVTARMVDQAVLERLGKWQRLDEFERRHVNQMPGGKVLYVEGGFTASIYPVGTTRLSYEVSVAD